MLRIFLFISICLSLGCASPYSRSSKNDNLGELRSIHYNKDGFFLDYSIVVSYETKSLPLVTIERKNPDLKYTTSRLGDLAGQLKNFSPRALPRMLCGKTERGTYDLGVVAITWFYSGGQYTIERDYKLKRRFEWRFYKINNIFEDIYMRVERETKEDEYAVGFLK